MRTISFDGVIVGGGGAGMRAALQLAQSVQDRGISKVFRRVPTLCLHRAALPALSPVADPNDDWRWHMYDTVKGSDYIGDQDAIEYMCSVGPEAIFELGAHGLAVFAYRAGRIYQRPFGGQSKNLARVGQAARPARQLTAPGTLCCTRCIRTTLKRDRSSLTSGSRLTGEEPGWRCGRRDCHLHRNRRDRLRKSKATVLATGGAGQNLCLDH